jgi:hypothetical protein
MKTFIILVLTLAGIFILLQSFVMYSVSGIEKHEYKVIKSYDDFEIRKYESALFSSVILNDSTYEKTSNNGFRQLAGYIFGGNEEGEKIAMTSPVAMEMGDSTKMSFMVPSNYDMAKLPKPNNGKIFFEQKPETIMAAIRFGGWANDEKIKEYEIKLSKMLDEEGIKHSGKFTYLGYNPPYAVVGRRNEVVVELINFKE